VITIDDLKASGLDEEKGKQVLDLLGDAGKKFTPENVGKKAFDEVDLSVLTLTKVPKLDNEKSTEYLKRAHSVSLEAAITEKTKALNDEIADVKLKLAAKPGDEKLMKELSDLKEEKAKFPDLINGKVKEWKDKAENAERELNDHKTTSQLKTALPAKFKADLPKKFIDYEVEGALKEARAKFGKMETGSDGILYLINETTYEKVKATDWFAAQLKDIVDGGTVQTGGGASGGAGTGGASELVLPKDMPKGEKILKIEAHLIQKGITKLDPKWDAEYKALMIKNELIVEKK
jgi:hypothetical protein